MYENVKQALANAPQLAGEIIDGACEARGFNRSNTPATTAQAVAQTEVPSRCNNMAQAMNAATIGGCGVYSRQIQETYNRKCQMVCDPCWLLLLDAAIGRQSWPMVRNQLGRTFLRFSPSGYVASAQPVPDPESAATANYVDAVPVAPGQAVLLRQEPKYTLPWRPGRLKLTLGFSAGDMANNMTHVQVKIYVMRRGSFSTSGALRSFAVEWTPDEHFTGDQFRCGDKCQDVQIIGSLGCAATEHVGDDNELLIVVYNDAQATNDITAVDAKVDFDGLKKPCCNACSSGSNCACG